MKSITEPGAWRDTLAEFSDRDFYHTFDYHRLEAERQSATPHLFYYERPGCRIVLPLLLRKIGDNQTELQDATSVYGYAGPLLDGSCRNSESFQRALANTLRNLNVVCVFSRLHPLLDSTNLLHGLGAMVQLGETVSIDLNDTPQSQWRQYRSNLRRDIKALRDSDVECVQSDDDGDIEEFAQLYHDTMNRRQASAEHMFTSRFVGRLCRSSDFDMRLFKCMQQKTMVCAGLFARCQDIVQYHLSATHGDHYHLAATKLLLDEVRLWAHEQGATIFHLGGGVGGAADSLFSFKKGFSKRVHRFYVWRWILDQARYDQLCELSDRTDGINDDLCKDANFFPYYRAPLRGRAQNP